MLKQIIFVLLTFCALLLSGCTAQIERRDEQRVLAEQEMREEMTAVLETYVQALAQQDMPTLQTFHIPRPSVEQLRVLHQTDVSLFASYQNIEMTESNIVTYSSISYGNPPKTVTPWYGRFKGHLYFKNDFVSTFIATVMYIENTDEWEVHEFVILPPNPQLNCPLQVASQNKSIKIGLCDTQILNTQLGYQSYFDVNYIGEKSTLCFLLFTTEELETFESFDAMIDYHGNYTTSRFECMNAQEQSLFSVTMPPRLNDEELKTDEPIIMGVVVVQRKAVDGADINKEPFYKSILTPIHQEFIEFTYRETTTP